MISQNGLIKRHWEAIFVEIDCYIIGVDLASGPDYSVMSDGTAIVNPEWEASDECTK